MTSHQHNCRLCDGPRGRARPGRLGRYSITCDSCDARRGSHLIRTEHGYESRAMHREQMPRINPLAA